MKEYKVEQYDLSLGTVGLEEKLNKKSAEGWELIAVSNFAIFIFCKEVG